MCGIFGFINYKNKPIKNLSNLTNLLAEESAVRGTNATGISFVSDDEICILKEAKSAYDISFKHSDNVKALIGHTRHTTQGSCKNNQNNHPFLGKCKNAEFSLAHNGVLFNDADLKIKYDLPKSGIQTDSYVAVQVLEYKKELTPDSIKFMAENVQGSFSFSILDDKNNIWLVKGDSPIEILRFPQYSLIVYASTEVILWRALINTGLLEEIKAGRYERIPIEEGDILKLTPTGAVEKYSFHYSEFSAVKSCNWWNYELYGIGYEDMYIEDLKSVAAYQGYSPEDIDELLENGFAPEEIEEYIYCMNEV